MIVYGVCCYIVCVDVMYCIVCVDAMYCVALLCSVC